MTRFVCFMTTVVLAAATTAFAQTPPPPPGGNVPQMPPPSNLQVLPKTMTTQQVLAVMRNFTGELGVKCAFCHDVKVGANGRPDFASFASDANPMKNNARVMIKMFHAINTDYLTQLTPKSQARVTCGTCHRGMSIPPAFVPPAPNGPPPAH